MRLKLSELEKLVERTVAEEEVSAEFKDEITRVLGPIMVTEGRLTDVAAAANDRLDVLDRTGRSRVLHWNSRRVSSWIDFSNPELRRFVARVVPESHLNRMMNDRNPGVRAAVASRLPANQVREMIKRFPKDDQLRSIWRTKTLSEAGLKAPEVEPMGHDPVDGKKRMGAAARTSSGPELSEAWYVQQARRLVQDYGGFLDNNWETIAVHRYCSSVKATSGIEVDASKLLEQVRELIKDKEDRAMEKNALKETLDWLEARDANALLEADSSLDVESVDPVCQLMECDSSDEFIERGKVLFKVQEAVLPLGIRKHRLGEGNARQVMVPVVGRLPHTGGFRSIDEKALDRFCEAWTRKQQLYGEPLRLEWTTHPIDDNRVGFTCILK